MHKNSYMIDLLHTTLEYNYELPNEKLVMVLGGRQPSSNWLKQLSVSYKNIWSIDRGLDICQKSDVIPTRLIGDLDSVNSTSLTWSQKKGIPTDAFCSKKDFTDTQLALSKASSELNNPYIILTAAFGGRLDHILSTIYTLAHSALGKYCVLTDQKELVIFLYDNSSCKFTIKKIPKAISLIPISSKCTGVNTSNLYWQLNNNTLSSNIPSTISNVIAGDKKIFSVSIDTGILAVYVCFDENNL